MIGRLNHVAIAVQDLAAASAIYRDTLGARVSGPLPLPDHGVTVVFVALENTKIELIEPLGEGSPLNGFLAKNPAGGQHHVCFEVPDIHAAVKFLSNALGIAGFPEPQHYSAEDLGIKYYGEVAPHEGLMSQTYNGGAFIEIQGTAEGHAFRRHELDALLNLAASGIAELFALQSEALLSP